MPDQRKKAGNIGDVFKHAVLPELVLLWLRTVNAGATYVETHAGFYTYDLKLLRLPSGKGWSGERAWALGIIAAAIADRHPGAYGAALRDHLPAGTYPGSIRLVEFATRSSPGGLRIAGFDTGGEQAASFSDAPARVSVREGDGYKNASTVPSPCLVFCDPFWVPGGDDGRQAPELLQRSEATIVWYPLTPSAESFRAWLEKSQTPHAELQFAHYVVPPWADQDLRGSGIAYSGLPSCAAETIRHTVDLLESIFRDQHVGQRRLDLGFSLSDGGRALEPPRGGLRSPADRVRTGLGGQWSPAGFTASGRR